jgi:ketosteroid isomerase-like protein
VTSSDVVRRFLDALNRRDLPAMLELVAPDVEIRSPRGPKHGHEGVREWLGDPYCELDVQRVVEREHVAGSVVVAVGRLRHCWREGGDVADEIEGAWLAEVTGGRISLFQSFRDEASALTAAGLAPRETPS